MLAAPRQDRFESLDVLRGVAVLAIFAINIQAMALPAVMFANPSLNTEFFNADGKAFWAIASAFFQFKFITIFSALFGAGVILMVGEEKPSEKFGIHYRRMGWLALFGLLHAFLIWYGDILFAYAIAGMIIVLARRWGPVTLSVVGLILITLGSGMMLMQGMMMEGMTPEQKAAMIAKMWAPPPEAITAQVEAYRGGFIDRLPFMAGTAIMFELVQTIALAPRNIGVMMLGMALYKSGFFTLGWSTLAYVVVGGLALAVGVYGSTMATSQMFAAEFDMAHMSGPQFLQYWASLPHALGYAAIVMLICKIPFAKILRAPFAAAGRMALSNYLACSIIGAFLYYGPPGLGLIGSASYGDLAKTVGAVWVATLIWSPIWLSIFRFGPFEWLWRSLTYGRAQPLLK